MEVKLIARTYELDEENCPTGSPLIEIDSQLLAGKAAGICYMPDDYLSEGINNEEKCLKRAKMTAENGHYSTWEHMSVSLLITDIPKMLAMMLNNTQYYSTSEKSGRYTKMEGVGKDKEYYDKWLNIFKALINLQYGDILSDSEIEKKAQENARYMLSVFTPTTMIFTCPYGRLMIVFQQLLSFANDAKLTKKGTFYTQLQEACKDFVNKACVALKIDKISLRENKFRKYPLFLPNNFIEAPVYYIIDTEDIDKEDYFGNTYTVNYWGSLAQLAQVQRHRTLNYSIKLPDKENIDFYIPKILTGRLRDKWYNDLAYLLSVEEIIPQATMVKITEQGTVENLVLKSFERMCNHAQLETALQTKEILETYYKNTESDYAKRYLLTFIDSQTGKAVRRCKAHYSCTSPDTFCINNIYFNDNKTI